MLDGLHLVDAHGKVSGIRQYAAEQFGAVGEIAGKLSEKVKKLGIAGD
jgi:hypothetical protein